MLFMNNSLRTHRQHEDFYNALLHAACSAQLRGSVGVDAFFTSYFSRCFWYPNNKQMVLGELKRWDGVSLTNVVRCAVCAPTYKLEI